MGGAEVAPARQAYLAGQKNVSWLIYVLGRSPDPAAFDALAKIASREKNYNARNVAHALALKGADGRKVLRQYADGPAEPMKYAAEEWLKRLDAGTVRTADWPAPRRGSLPKRP